MLEFTFSSAGSVSTVRFYRDNLLMSRPPLRRQYGYGLWLLVLITAFLTVLMFQSTAGEDYMVRRQAA